MILWSETSVLEYFTIWSLCFDLNPSPRRGWGKERKEEYDTLFPLLRCSSWQTEVWILRNKGQFNPFLHSAIWSEAYVMMKTGSLNWKLNTSNTVGHSPEARLWRIVFSTSLHPLQDIWAATLHNTVKEPSQTHTLWRQIKNKNRVCILVLGRHWAVTQRTPLISWYKCQWLTFLSMRLVYLSALVPGRAKPSDFWQFYSFCKLLITTKV